MEHNIEKDEQGTPVGGSFTPGSTWLRVNGKRIPCDEETYRRVLAAGQDEWIAADAPSNGVGPDGPVPVDPDAEFEDALAALDAQLDRLQWEQSELYDPALDAPTDTDVRWKHLNLVDMSTANAERATEMLVPTWIVLGAHHTSYGPKEQGKTWIALAAHVAPLLLAGKTVAWIDFEMSRHSIMDRLLLLGVPREVVVERLLYFEAPLLDGSQESKDEWKMMLAEYRPALVVCDAGAGAYATAGLDEDKTRDVLKWDSWYFATARRAGASTEMLDHVGHDSQGRARGASGKGAAAKVEFEFTLIEPFSPECVGKVRVSRNKNTLAADIPAERVYLLGGTPFVFEESGDLFHAQTSEQGLYRRVENTITDAGPEGLTTNAVLTAVGGSKASVRRTLKQLVADSTSVVNVRDGDNRSKVYYADGHVG